jgi:hypothetical protein
MQNYFRHLQTVSPSQYSLNRKPTTSDFAACFVVSLPILFFLAIACYRKYKVTVRCRQIKRLEKLWRISSQKWMP